MSSDFSLNKIKTEKSAFFSKMNNQNGTDGFVFVNDENMVRKKKNKKKQKPRLYNKTEKRLYFSKAIF